MGIAREDLENSIAQVAGSADVVSLVPFAERFWSESVWEFGVANLNTLALVHVSRLPELWVFVKDIVGQMDGLRMAQILATFSWKCRNYYPA